MAQFARRAARPCAFGSGCLGQRDRIREEVYSGRAIAGARWSQAADSSDLGRGGRRDGAEIGYGLPRARGVQAMIKELDPVVLTESLPEQGLQAGDVGWVVLIHAGGGGYEVEFVTLAGETVSVVTVPARAVRPVRAKEIAHARMVA